MGTIHEGLKERREAKINLTHASESVAHRRPRKFLTSYGEGWRNADDSFSTPLTRI
jgi:hypothetical protein